MTALSGTAKSLTALSVYRIGVGIGESTASPSSYSIFRIFSPKSDQPFYRSIRVAFILVQELVFFLVAGLLNSGQKHIQILASLLSPQGMASCICACWITRCFACILYVANKRAQKRWKRGIESIITTDPLTALKDEFIGISPLLSFQQIIDSEPQ